MTPQDELGRDYDGTDVGMQEGPVEGGESGVPSRKTWKRDATREV